MGSRKQEGCLEQTCHIGRGFNSKAYCLPAGGDDEDQVVIIVGGE